MEFFNLIFCVKKYKSPCKYPTTCTRRDCLYKHEIVPECKFGDRCFNKQTCRFIHVSAVKRAYPPRQTDFPKTIAASPIKRARMDFKKAVLSYDDNGTYIIDYSKAVEMVKVRKMVEDYENIKHNDNVKKIVFKF